MSARLAVARSCIAGRDVCADDPGIHAHRAGRVVLDADDPAVGGAGGCALIDLRRVRRGVARVHAATERPYLPIGQLTRHLSGSSGAKSVPPVTYPSR